MHEPLDLTNTTFGRDLSEVECDIAADGHVNTGPEHMPGGLADHLNFKRRLAARGQKDES